jgi:hypothetical protein
MNNFTEKVKEIANNFFTVAGQSKRFLIGKPMILLMLKELEEIQSECNDNKY